LFLRNPRKIDKRVKKLLFIFAILMVSSIVLGQDFSKVGTSSAQFLKFPVDARTSSLGGSHSGIYGDVASLHWNPAGIAAIDRFAVALSYFNLYVGIQHSFLGVVTQIGRNNAIGLSAIILDSGEIEETTIAEPDGTGANFKVKNYAFGLTYARYMTEWLMFGGTIKYVREDIWHETAQAVAFDIGTVLETGILGMKLGISMSNLGTNMKLEGQDLMLFLVTPGFTQEHGSELKTEAWPLPWMFQAGVAIDVLGGSNQAMVSSIHRVTVLGQYSELNDAGTRGNFGVEYQWNNTLSARLGYYNQYDSARFSYGLGASFDVDGKRFDLDYALVDYNKLDFVHQTTLSMKF